jgi:hypothetical protein
MVVQALKNAILIASMDDTGEKIHKSYRINILENLIDSH